MSMIRSALALAAGAALAATLAGPALAADGAYSVTVAGQRANTPLVNLASSSQQTVNVSNLPANVSLYVLHCKVPADPRTPPVNCDSAAGSLAYLPATPEARASVAIPVTINGEFYGTNPNPTTASSDASVDCRVDTGNPRMTTCALYVMGAGRDSANPAYLKVFPTSFLPVSAKRTNDAAVITLAGKALTKGAKPALKQGVATPFSVALKSGLTPTVTADNCTIADGKITALKDQGTCIVRITSNGGKNVKPLVTTQVILLRK